MVVNRDVLEVLSFSDEDDLRGRIDRSENELTVSLDIGGIYTKFSASLIVVK